MDESAKLDWHKINEYMQTKRALELAAALREHNAWRMGLPPYDRPEQPRHLEGAALSAIIDQAATALETYAQEAAKWGEWRTMTDVPLDGSKIWLYSPETDLRYIAYWGRGYIEPKGFEVREPADGWINAACFEPYIIDARISNWMPLPPKPLARAEKMGV